MTICIATSDYLPDLGGISTFNIHLSSLLRQEGHTVIILTIDFNSGPDKEDSIESAANGSIVVKLKKSFQYYYGDYKKYFSPGGIDAPYWIAMGIAMQNWLIKNQTLYPVDIIEASAYGGIGIFLQHETLPPVLLTGHGTFFQYKRYNKNLNDDHTAIIQKLEKLSIANADGFISHSPQSKNDIQPYAKQQVHLAKIPFLNKKIDHSFDTSSSITNNFSVVVGGLQPLKGPLILSEALLLLKKNLPDFIINWIGADSFAPESKLLMSEMLKRKYHELWGKNFVWKNLINETEKQKLLHHALFVTIPTIWESFNYVALEAASLGKAIIITDKTGAAYLFTHGRDVLIVPANDPQQLAEAIIQLKNNPALCQEMGNNARKMIEIDFDPQKIVAERIAIYKQTILNRKNRKEFYQEHIVLLKNYITPARKFYYRLRAKAKKLIKGYII